MMEKSPTQLPRKPIVRACGAMRVLPKEQRTREHAKTKGQGPNQLSEFLTRQGCKDIVLPKTDLLDI